MTYLYRYLTYTIRLRTIPYTIGSSPRQVTHEVLYELMRLVVEGAVPLPPAPPTFTTSHNTPMSMFLGEKKIINRNEMVWWLSPDTKSSFHLSSVAFWMLKVMCYGLAIDVDCCCVGFARPSDINVKEPMKTSDVSFNWKKMTIRATNER